jgi:hypothetical protein
MMALGFGMGGAAVADQAVQWAPNARENALPARTTRCIPFLTAISPL